MGDRSLEVQKAVKALIAADATIMTTYGVTGIYDIPTPDAAFPYLRISEINVTPQEIKVEDWFEYFMNIHVWDLSDGTIRTRNIVSAIHDLFHRNTLTLDSGYQPSTYVLNSQVLIDPDNVTQHGVIRIRVVD